MTWGPGETYHLVFTTSTQRNARATDITVYDDFIQQAADAAGIGLGSSIGDISWKVLGSTPTVDAINHVGVMGPVYRLDDQRIANDEADLFDGQIQVDMDLTELLTTAPSGTVYTGSNDDGTASSPIGSSVSTRLGQPRTLTDWLRSAFLVGSQSSRPFYAISEPLTTPCPIVNVTQSVTYERIQTAIDAANPGDVIQLSACRYEAAFLLIFQDSLTLRGAGRGLTIIDGDFFDRVFVCGFSNATVEDLTVKRGSNPAGGSGVIAGLDCDLTFRRVEFIECDNGVVDSSSTASILFDACRFSNNVTTGGASIGGGEGDITFINCLFDNNSGGNYTLLADDATLVNTTFADNSDDIAVAGVSVASSVSVINSVFDGANPLGSVSMFISVATSLFSGSVGNNINGTPTFVDPNNGDYRLAARSLGIDAANEAAYTNAGGGSVDLNDAPRFVDDAFTQNNGAGSPNYLDMGASEFECELLGDCDTDGDVDLADFEALVQCLLGPDVGVNFGCDCYDIDEDGDIDLPDFGRFQLSYSD